MRYELNIQVDHAQFYLEDSLLKADTSELWKDSLQDGIAAVAEGLIAVGTARYNGNTRVVVETLSERPIIDVGVWDSTLESSIHIPSGVIIVYAPEQNPIEAPHIKILPGFYHSIIACANTNSVVDEMSLEGDDYYHVFLWINN